MRFALLHAFVCCATASVFAAQPNILLIVGDDMGYADVGAYGCKDIPTPNLDALAASGVRFTNGYVTGPYCSPTRAGLLTGRYQNRFGHEFNPSGEKSGLPISEQTIADRLKSAGYATGLIGKWHLGSTPSMHPQQRGFTEFYGFLGGAHDYFKSAGILRGTTPVTELDYTTDSFAREAVSFIESHQKTPWFLYLSFTTDIGETKDLAATMPEKVTELQAKWDTWNTGNVKPLWGGGNSDSDGAEPGAAPRRKNRKQEK